MLDPYTVTAANESAQAVAESNAPAVNENE
jgi:hypothetical protein